MQEYNALIEFYWAPILVEFNPDLHIIADPNDRILRVDKVSSCQELDRSGYPWVQYLGLVDEWSEITVYFICIEADLTQTPFTQSLYRIPISPPLDLNTLECLDNGVVPWIRQLIRAGLNLEIAQDLVANQLNVRNGALVLQVYLHSVLFLVSTYVFSLYVVTRFLEIVLQLKLGLLPTTRGFAGENLDDYSVGDKVLLKIQRGSENLELPLILEEKSS
ncbi:hypothetical protein HHK36_007236 [Tetracentron sinense]|uniref:Uncharacterized protein n=1 Tax=Tetracentron sinense TaxID=13715 RepID=A0A834ZIJ5_TETSI|nr:hypothetical protein HHK36_007236 [Tetracentron sinense]